jgi:hypothetical protein
MFTKTDSKTTLKTKLNKVLKEYQLVANQDPDTLRLALPSQEIWRFFVDGYRQSEDMDVNTYFDLGVLKHPIRANYYNFSLDKIQYTNAVTSDWRDLIKHLHLDEQIAEKVTVKELLLFNQGWFLCERREKGCLKAFYRAFNVIFEQHHTLDLAFILRLHALATAGVENTNYAKKLKDKEARVGTLRANPKCHMAYGLIPSNTSKEGLFELLQQDDSYLKYSFSIKTGCENSFMQERIQRARSAGQKANHLYHCVTKTDDYQLIYESTEANPELLTIKAVEFINEYNNAISESYSLLDKLNSIVVLIQSLEQLHMFYDANCRTLCMLLLNHLLLMNGLPLCIQYNPNRFDMCSHHELVQSVIQGMENTFTLLRTGELFKVNTPDLIEMAKLPNALGASYDYFDSAVTLEDRARRRVAPRTPALKRKSEEIHSPIPFCNKLC